MDPLPIEKVLPDILSSFGAHRNVILSADPGAGKTTRVPLALLQEEWLDAKRIVMLEPRRLAARRAAEYMAEQLGEHVGSTVGYRIRGESKIGRATRVEVVTEGILTRFLQADASLSGVGLVVFDEFHERSIHADLGLALTLDAQAHVRPDLRILIMSATLDILPLTGMMDDVSTVKSEGRTFPVATRYLDRPHDGHVESLVAATIARALQEEGRGDVLVFLPGQREIRKVESLLEQKELPENVRVHLLFGEASADQQRLSLAPAFKGTRKVILSTSVAETSLTIDGVRVVIDSGLARVARLDPRRGMSGLVTTPVSQAVADQRRGRAGRQGPGVCYRLWSEKQHAELPGFPLPEIQLADLAPLALDLARWGDPEGKKLKFLSPPPPAHLAQARDLLHRLGALDEKGHLTDHGRAMSEVAVHPRLAHMLIRGKQLGLGSLACDVAALLEERDLLQRAESTDVDILSRWRALHEGSVGDKFARDRVRSQSARLRQFLGMRDESMPEDKLGVLLALAYPERVGRRRGAHGERYQLSGGTGAILPKGSPLARFQYLAVADVDGSGGEVRVFLAAPLGERDLLEVFADQIDTIDEVHWDPRHQNVVARRVTRLGALELSEGPFEPESRLLVRVMVEGLRALGLDVLPWSKDAVSLRARSEWLRTHGLAGEGWPDLSDGHLMETLDRWLGPHLVGVTRRSQLKKLDTMRIMRSLFTPQQLRNLEQLAPTHVVVPTGSRIPLDYSKETQPVLAVRLQEMFGETETPTIARGKVKVLLHLLSPAHRPLAVTQDLPSFWKNAYIGVRKDMRGQYPKHEWPENPLKAEPTRRSKRRK